MSYAGTVLDAISRYNNNRAQQKYRKDKYKELRGAYNNTTYKMKYADKDLTDEERAAVKSKIRNFYKRERRRITIVYFFGTMVALLTVFYIFNRINLV